MKRSSSIRRGGLWRSCVTLVFSCTAALAATEGRAAFQCLVGSMGQPRQVKDCPDSGGTCLREQSKSPA